MRPSGLFVIFVSIFGVCGLEKNGYLNDTVDAEGGEPFSELELGKILELAKNYSEVDSSMNVTENLSGFVSNVSMGDTVEAVPVVKRNYTLQPLQRISQESAEMYDDEINFDRNYTVEPQRRVIGPSESEPEVTRKYKVQIPTRISTDLYDEDDDDDYSPLIEPPATESTTLPPTPPPTPPSTNSSTPKPLFIGRDPAIFRAEMHLPPLTTTTEPPPTSPSTLPSTRTPITIETYSPSPLPEIDNNVFREFARLSKLTEYMLVDPLFATDYANDRLSNSSKILYMVYGDVVKHIFSSEQMTYKKPPRKSNRIRYRMKSLNNKQPLACSQSGKETYRIFCPFSYGYNWWDCLSPHEVCDGHPHCGLGDDEDPKMCLYYRASVSKIRQTEHDLLAEISRVQKELTQKLLPTADSGAVTLGDYNPDFEL